MIVKVGKRERNFTQIANETLRDEALSWKARGILAYLLSLPDDWEVHILELKEHAPDGITSLRSGLEELELAGYVVRKILRKDDGTFLEWALMVHELPVPEQKRTSPDDRKKEPVSGNPQMDNPQVDNPDVENLHTTNKEGTKKDSTKKEKDLSGKPDKPPTPHQLMVKALHEVTAMDMSIKTNAGRIVRASKELRDAGYSGRDVQRYFENWKKTDWRWKKKRQRPGLTTIKNEIGVFLKTATDDNPEKARAAAVRELQKARANNG